MKIQGSIFQSVKVHWTMSSVCTPRSSLKLGRTTDKPSAANAAAAVAAHSGAAAADYLYNPSKCHKMKVQDDISFKAMLA